MRAFADPDAFLPTDVGVRHGLERLGVEPRSAVEVAEAWRPWRGAAACALWAYYRATKKREGALTTNAAQPELPRPGRSSPRKRRPR
jgi:AraC family transcriptional regulator of adaptative response / DNA-3-methyladenine glycosylase II